MGIWRHNMLCNLYIVPQVCSEFYISIACITCTCNISKVVAKLSHFWHHCAWHLKQHVGFNFIFWNELRVFHIFPQNLINVQLWCWFYILYLLSMRIDEMNFKFLPQPMQINRISKIPTTSCSIWCRLLCEIFIFYCDVVYASKHDSCMVNETQKADLNNF